MIFVCVALIVGFVLGAIEGRAAVQKAQEVAQFADTEAKAIKEATAHAVEMLLAHIQSGEHAVVAEYAAIIAKLRSAL